MDRGGNGFGSGMYHVVSGYSKAIDDDDGSCKNAELYPLAKHDFSTLICVTPETQHDLITQGWPQGRIEVMCCGISLSFQHIHQPIS